MEPITDCRSTDSVVAISFDQATLTRSNLGGVGPDFGAPPTLYFANVGHDPQRGRVDLEVFNLSAYRPSWATYGTLENRLINSTNGTFAQIGLQVPQRGETGAVAFVELRFAFRDAHGRPLALHHTDFSLYDFDASRSLNVRECVATRSPSHTILPEASTLQPIAAATLPPSSSEQRAGALPPSIEELTRQRGYDVALCGTAAGVRSLSPNRLKRACVPACSCHDH
jgi:hypothetical protein